ncbi:MAG: very short patch repair endonuclease [Actinobacteria bacterium]|nr:very short patch repair endonuclease [Actinomycetota bacterium]
MDNVKKETRSRMMSAVRDKNTKLEIEIRRRLFAKGFRFRIHRKDLPGTPDIVFPRYNAIIFVHGCFWHMHGCPRSRLPDTRQAWWKAKLEDNKRRDEAAVRDLEDAGWRVMLIWECGYRRKGVRESEALDEMAEAAAVFLESQTLYTEIPQIAVTDMQSPGLEGVSDG